MIKKKYGWSSKGRPSEGLALISCFAELFAQVNTDESCDSIRDRIAQEIAIGGARIDRKLRQGTWSWELTLWNGAAFTPVAGIFDPDPGDDGDPYLLVIRSPRLGSGEKTNDC